MIKKKVCLTCGKVYIVGLTGNQWGCKNCINPVPEPQPIPQPKLVVVTKTNSFGKFGS